MPQMFGIDQELSSVSPDIAWKLVDRLFSQTSSILIGAAAFMMLGLISYAATGSGWYLTAAAASGCT